HLRGEFDLPEWIEGYEGDVGGVINAIDSLDMVARQVGTYAPPDQLEQLRDLMLAKVGEAVLRDFDGRFSSEPEDADRGSRVSELREGLVREFALAGFDWDPAQARLRPRAAELQSAEEAKSVLQDSLERSG